MRPSIFIRLSPRVPVLRCCIRLMAAAFAMSAVFGAPSAQAQSIKVRFAYVPVVGAAPLFVFANAGWAAEAGLDIVPVRFESGPPAIAGLASGTIDALAIGIGPIAVARARNLDVSIISAVSNGGSGFVASPELADFLAPGADVAKGFADFRVKTGRPARLATLPPGGVPTITLYHWLFVLNHVAREHVQISAMGIDAVQQAVLSGAVDGGTVLEPALTIVLMRNPKLKMIATANEMFEAIPGVVIGISGAFARAHPGVSDILVKLTRRATDFIAQKPDVAASYVQTIFGGGLVDPAILARALTSKAISFAPDPHAIEEPTRRMLAYQVQLGDFAQAPSTLGLFDMTSYDRVAAQ